MPGIFIMQTDFYFIEEDKRGFETTHIISSDRRHTMCGMPTNGDAEKQGHKTIGAVSIATLSCNACRDVLRGYKRMIEKEKI